MDIDSRYFLALLTAFLNNQSPPDPDGADWKRVYELSCLHSLSGAVYLAMKKLPEEYRPETRIYNGLQSAFCNTLLRYGKQDALISKISDQLNLKGIRHIFFKGAVLRRLYPVSQMRTLGDIDLFIRDTDQAETDAALREMGCSLESSDDAEWKYYLNELLIEIHYKVNNDFMKRKAETKDYFDSVWENAHSIDGGFTWELDTEYHLIYLIAHMAKHLYNKGCGIRMLMDIAVILNNYCSELNYENILSELKKISLDSFACSIFTFCRTCFALPELPAVTLRIKQDKEGYEDMADYFLKGGTFGFYNSRPFSYLIRQELEHTDNGVRARHKALFRKLFPEPGWMQNKYPVLIKYPFLLPAAWIARGIMRILFRRKRTLKILKAFTESDDAKKDYLLLHKIGL